MRDHPHLPPISLSLSHLSISPFLPLAFSLPLSSLPAESACHLAANNYNRAGIRFASLRANASRHSQSENLKITKIPRSLRLQYVSIAVKVRDIAFCFAVVNNKMFANRSSALHAGLRKCKFIAAYFARFRTPNIFFFN